MVSIAGSWLTKGANGFSDNAPSPGSSPSAGRRRSPALLLYPLRLQQT